MRKKTSGVGKEWSQTLTSFKKVKSKWIIGPNIRAETIQVSERIAGFWVRSGLNFISKEEPLLISTIV